MSRQFTTSTVYFLQEGKENLEECLRIAFQAAKLQNISKIVIFTAQGEGIRLALEKYCSQPEFADIKLVAVTFPAGKVFSDAEKQPISIEFPPDNLKLLQDHGVPIIKSHLPFDPISPYYSQRGVLGQDLCLISETLNMICGSMGLCVQAIALACDAGAVNLGEHVIALTSDTAILAQAASTRRMLGELVIREILCKPAILTISRGERADRLLPEQMKLASLESPEESEVKEDADPAPAPKVTNSDE